MAKGKILFVESKDGCSYLLQEPLQEAGYDSVAWQHQTFLSNIPNGLHPFSLIFIEVMMLHGSELDKHETQYGRYTGNVLYRLLREKNESVPVVLIYADCHHRNWLSETSVLTCKHFERIVPSQVALLIEKAIAKSKTPPK